MKTLSGIGFGLALILIIFGKGIYVFVFIELILLMLGIFLISGGIVEIFDKKINESSDDKRLSATLLLIMGIVLVIQSIVVLF